MISGDKYSFEPQWGDERFDSAIDIESDVYESLGGLIDPLVVIPPTADLSSLTDSCQLGGYITDPNDAAKVVITPGWLHAPNKSELIEPSTRTPVAGETVWIKCPWTATLNSDGVLEAGGELGTPVVEQGAAMPSNTVPHVASLTGIYYVPLGAWDVDLVWIKEGCGAIHLNFCPRVFSLTRGEAA